MKERILLWIMNGVELGGIHGMTIEENKEKVMAAKMVRKWLTR
jgi:hypothetical protein